MKKYAYVDKIGVMHIVDTREVAEDFKQRGKVVETEIKAKNGFPIDETGEGVIVYGEDKMKYEAKGADIVPIPAFAVLYRKCIE